MEQEENILSLIAPKSECDDGEEIPESQASSVQGGISGSFELSQSNEGMADLGASGTAGIGASENTGSEALGSSSSDSDSSSSGSTESESSAGDTGDSESSSAGDSGVESE